MSDSPPRRSAFFDAFKKHWPEYLMEATGLGLFMISACGFAVLLFHPESPVVDLIASGVARRVLMGLAMGGTAVALIYSPWGKQSGAHLNPAVTLTFLRLGKVAAVDAAFYVVFQTLGGLAGVIIMAVLLRRWISDPSINYVATVPGSAGIGIAWITEFLISAMLMSAVLIVSNTPRIARWTGFFAGILVAANISLVAPLSGMSMNPARTLASAIPSGVWTAIWVYFTAPPIAMMLAAQCYLWAKGRGRVFCAKLHHENDRRCIFCDWREASQLEQVAASGPVCAPTEDRQPDIKDAHRPGPPRAKTSDRVSRNGGLVASIDAIPGPSAVVLRRSGSKGSQPELLGEIRDLLRRRLLTSCGLATGAWLLVVAFCYSGSDVLINADVLGSTCMTALMVATVLIPTGGLVILCWRTIPMVWMRVVEVSLFGVSAVALAWLRFALYDHVLDDDFPAAAAGFAVGYTAAFCGFTLYSLIVVHGVFVPNTWCQTMRMALMMALIVCAAEVLAWRGHPEALAEHFVSPMVLNGLTLMLGLGTAVFGSYKIGQLRTEAIAAKRQVRELGQYQLKELIGAGGMGEVYLAEHRLLKRPCAIKLIRPERAGDAKRQRRPRTASAYELLCRRQHEVLRRRPVSAPQRRFRRNPTSRRGVTRLADFVRRVGNVLHAGRTALSSPRPARRRPDRSAGRVAVSAPTRQS